MKINDIAKRQNILNRTREKYVLPFCVFRSENQARNSVHHLREENSYRNQNGEIISISSRQNGALERFDPNPR